MRPKARTAAAASRIALVFAVLLSACDDDPVGTLDPEDCTVELDDACWTFLGLKERHVTALADTPWGLFAGTLEDGVFRYDPGAESWRPLGLDSSPVGSILFVPGSTPRLMVGMRPRGEHGVSAAVLATQDAGRTWLPWDGGLTERYDNRRQSAHALAMDPGDYDRLYMGQSASLLRSTDGGHTWQYVFGGPEFSGAGVSAISVSRARDGHVWATATSGLGAGVIYRSENWGDSWEAVFPFTVGDYAISDLAVDERDPQRLWAAVSGRLSGIIRSEDSGKTWELVLSKPHAFLTVLRDRQNLYAAGYTNLRVPPNGAPPHLSDLTLYRSTDGGLTWSDLAVPEEASGAWVASFDFKGRLLIGTRTAGGGVWRFQP